MNRAFERILDGMEEKLKKSEERYHRCLDDSDLPCMFDRSDIEEIRINTIKEMLEIVQEVAAEHTSTEYINYSTKYINYSTKYINYSTNTSTDSWIPCSERLPEESGTYIVNAIENSIVHVTFAKWMPRIKKWNLTGSRSYWKVNAWMPLPEPYKEGEHETANVF